MARRSEVHGIGFAGVKGFAGGFGRGVLGPWGEDVVKRFVHEAVERSAEARIARSRACARRRGSRCCTTRRSRKPSKASRARSIPYLGCGRLEEPLTRYPVTAVFHGHAHHGSAEGKTLDGTPVYNVSLPLLLAAESRSARRACSMSRSRQRLTQDERVTTAAMSQDTHDPLGLTRRVTFDAAHLSDPDSPAVARVARHQRAGRLCRRHARRRDHAPLSRPADRGAAGSARAGWSW